MSFQIIEQKPFTEPSAITLILANLIPVYGAIFLGWKVFDIVIFYWLETIIVGLFNVFKIALCQGKAPKDDDEAAKAMGPLFEYLHKKGKESGNYNAEKNSVKNQNLDASKTFLIIFFLFHYNFFIFVQFIFIIVALSPDSSLDPFNMFDVFEHIYLNTEYLFVGLLGIVVSHAHSLYLNFIKGEEYLTSNAGTQMFKPYGRIIIQQFVVIIGGGIAMVLNAPLLILILLVIFKIIVDLISHGISHKTIQFS